MRRCNGMRVAVAAALAGAVIVLLAPASAWAQTGPALLLEPWDEPTLTQTDVDARIYEPAAIDDTDADLRLRRYQLRGRFRTDAHPGDQDVRIGYDMVHWDVRRDDSTLPRRLNDSSVAIGWTQQLTEHRRLGVASGIGYSGDRRFGTRRALYFKADILVQQPLNQNTMLTVGINYDGNRAIWPDVPLPYVAFAQRVSDELSYTLGIPASVRYTPIERVALSASYVPPVTVNVRGEFMFDDAWSLFGSFENENRGFAVDDDVDRRTFFRQRRLEAGIEYQPHYQWHALVGVGVAFDQRFARGWDVRSTSTIRDVRSARYVRAAVNFEF